MTAYDGLRHTQLRCRSSLKQQEELRVLLRGAIDTFAVTEASPSAIGEQAELMEGGSDWKSPFSVMVSFDNLVSDEFGEDEYTADVSTLCFHADYKCLEMHQCSVFPVRRCGN